MTHSPPSSLKTSLSTQRVGLFVTCLVDLMRPSVGFAALRVLARAGVEAVVPHKQVCCGQPAYNSGAFAQARAIARDVIETFENFDQVVVPSGSCAGMIRVHYPQLFADDPLWYARAQTLAGRVSELSEYLAEFLDLDTLPARLDVKVAYHDSCASRRELGVVDQPRKLLGAIEGLELRELEDTETCCGFGGLFSVKFPDVSGAIVTQKAKQVEATGADMLVGADLGCLMNIAGKLKREGSDVRVFHIAEVLAGMTDIPGIGEGET